MKVAVRFILRAGTKPELVERQRHYGTPYAATYVVRHGPYASCVPSDDARRRTTRGGSLPALLVPTAMRQRTEYLGQRSTVDGAWCAVLDARCHQRSRGGTKTAHSGELSRFSTRVAFRYTHDISWLSHFDTRICVNRRSSPFGDVARGRGLLVPAAEIADARGIAVHARFTTRASVDARLPAATVLVAGVVRERFVHVRTLGTRHGRMEHWGSRDDAGSPCPRG